MVTALLAVACVLLLLLLIVACRKLETSQAEARSEADRHSECHDRVAGAVALVSGRIRSDLLRTLADRWDSVEEQPNLRRLAAEEYSPGGPSMPAIWLRQQARLIDNPTPIVWKTPEETR